MLLRLLRLTVRNTALAAVLGAIVRERRLLRPLDEIGARRRGISAHRPGVRVGQLDIDSWRGSRVSG
jgi:hypothetical protein